ncbi:putative sodium/calcium exchanger membrane region, EF-hand domain pair [Rosa chinensis]|uniref:Putative sodium/calcium exchanger membrane region, EF-hand domain pair n=1 Tax=Rosa chinensis TaxID=74649 RepID=A0A2P6QA95_ROSCH|nr:putative sodium/calcium exchanger membrane region, EF-hand domain pair [Rosa chinensis]
MVEINQAARSSSVLFKLFSYPLLSCSNSSEDCSLLYGLFPCTYTVLGKLFLIVGYVLLYIIGEYYVVAGGKLIFEVNGSVGANLFHLLSAIPDAIILLVSGLTASTETAQSKVSIGVGLLVGSTVFCLSAVWGLCVYAGKCDLEGTEGPRYKRHKKVQPIRYVHLPIGRLSLIYCSGVSTKIWTTYAARIMVISIIPVVVSQIPQVLHLSSGGQHLAILIALIVSVILTIAYIFYELLVQFYCEPLIQTSRINYVEHKQAMSGLLIYLDSCAQGELLTSNGEPNKDVLESGFVSPDEMRTLIIKIQSAETGSSRNHDQLDNIMKEFDRSGDKCIDVTEFIAHITEWLNKAKCPKNAFHEPGRQSIKYSFTGIQKVINQEHYMLVSEKNKRDEDVKSPKWISFKAAMMLLLGTCIAVLVADPLVDAVDDFSEATSIPTFFVSFIVLPLATNSCETLSAIKMARQKTQRTVSSTLSEGLYWDFRSEVLVLVIVCIVMGALTSFRTILPLWTSVVAVLLYPLLLALVYILHFIFGWS